jgi:hypothetical protein
MSVTLDCTSPFDAENFKLNSDGGSSGSKEFKRGSGGAYGGSVRVCVWRVWSQAVGFVLVRLTGIWLQSP